MLIQLLAPCLALLVGPIAAGYVTVPLQSPAGVTYVNSQQHVGLLAGPVRYTSSTAAAASSGTVPVVDAHSGAVSVTPGPTPTHYSYNVQQQARSGPVSVTSGTNPTYYSYNVEPQARSGPVSVTSETNPTYYSYNVQPQPVFGKASYSPAVQYPTVRVYDPRSFVYGVQSNNVPSTHTVHTVPVSVSTTQYHHTPEPVPVTPAPHHPTIAVPVPTPVPVHIPVHVPVPVPVTPTYTKTVTTGPTYVEKQVPVVRSRKFKVRRPAIQNQFYDIEERVIIRPVGSALVELEQPISQTETQSKTTKTTTTTFVEKRPPVYVPAPPPPPPAQPEIPAGDSGYGTRTIGRPRVVTQTTTVYTERPQVVVQKNTYDRVRVIAQDRSQERTQSAAQPAQSAASTSKASDAEFIDTSANVPTQRPFYTQGHAIYHPQQTDYVPHPFATPLTPHPFVYHPGNAGHLLHHVAYLDQHHSLAGHPGALHPGSVYHPVPSTTPLYPVTPVVPAAGADCEREGKAPEYLPPTPAPPVVTTTPQPPSASPGSFADAEEEEYDDSIVVNARSGAGEANSDSVYEDSTASGYAGTTVRPNTPAAPTNLHHDKYRGAGQSQSQSQSLIQSQSQSQSQSQERSSIEISYATRTTPASDIVAFDPSTSSGAFNLGPSPSAFRGSFSTTTPSPTTISLDGGTSSTASSSTPQRSVTIVSSTTPRTVSARFSETEVESSSSSAAISSPSVVVGQGLTQEQIHANQEQFIKLLSERDSIAQVGFDAKGDTTSGTLIDAYVRSRVLSATPAPRDAKESSRTVNIRRIVVSRPVETEQEVEVREQGYATSVSPPSYEHKRDVSDVASARSDAASDESQQPPVYVNAKPPAFAADQDAH